MAHEQVSISYRGYDAASKVLFESLLNNDEFADVTLVCDDERIIKAHKVILCAFSPFFKNILLKVPSPHPVIYMSGICFKDLQCILQFIYRGETQVEDTGVDSFFGSAQKLKIMGIYPLANFEQKKLPNLSQIFPGVFAEETHVNHVNGNESPADISNMLNVVIKEEPEDEVQEDEQENVAVFVKTEEISIKQENIEVRDQTVNNAESQPQNIEKKHEIKEENIEKNLEMSQTEIKPEKSVDMYTRIKNRHKLSPKKVNYTEMILKDSEMDDDLLLTQSKQNEPPILGLGSSKPIFKSERVIGDHWITPSRLEKASILGSSPSNLKSNHKLLKCKHCTFKTIKYLLLKNHVERIHPRPPTSTPTSAPIPTVQCNITCNYCGSKFMSVANLNVHKTEVHNVIRA